MMNATGVDGGTLMYKYVVNSKDDSGCGNGVKSRIDMLYSSRQRIGKLSSGLGESPKHRLAR